jgi:pyrimidine-nucleoside phosphorylase
MTKALGPDHGAAGHDASARILDAITDKRADRPLAAETIDGIVRDIVSGRLPDYQVAAFLATVACQGMTAAETAALTAAYVAGGSRLRLSELDGFVIDKHSTGGVGDKVSLVVVPVVAACGVVVAKMSGRGLGYAGGTVDKLESIPGLRMDLNADELRRILSEAGMAITGQSADLAPGDGATYRMRDVTATVESVPLIAASIISKKVALGADGLVLDVKSGEGALMADQAEAERLAETMLDLARAFGLPCRVVLSDMSQPLGYAVGNALEVREALAALRGQHVPGLSEVCQVIARLMLQLAEPGLPEAAADGRIAAVLGDGSAHRIFLRWAAAQGGDARVLADESLLPHARYRQTVAADRDGFVSAIDPRAIGAAAIRLGAGRLVQGEQLDHAAGIVLCCRVGSRVQRGEPVAVVHYGARDPEPALALTHSAFTIGDTPGPERPAVHRILGLESAPRVGSDR